MMKVALHDAERDHMPHKTYPNLALMKISAWHKRQGDHVEWWEPLLNQTYDIVYSSKVFDFTPENPFLPQNTIKGGTGYNVKSKLPKYIDDMYPDYSIYAGCDYAIGFLTRGCNRNCPWCVVPEKEGKLRPYSTWEQVARHDTDKIVLMDNNILDCDYGLDQLVQLSGTKYKIDINQGMDARIVTPEIADILRRIHWIKYIRFSCDTEQQVKNIENVYRMFKAVGIPVSRLFVYFIVRKDLNEASRRIEGIKKLKGISIYAQAEQNAAKGIIPNKAQKEFANRYIYGRLYKTETWTEYCSRKGLRFEGDKP